MANDVLSRDENRITVLGGVTNDANKFIKQVLVDPVTGALLVTGTGLAGGTVTTVSVATANGVSGTVATATTTPAITLALGAITPTSVNGVTVSGSATPTLAVSGTTSVSGANTGDQTNITGNAGTATLAATSTLANDVANATDYLVFSNGATGAQALKTATAISVNPSTAAITATTFIGALSGNATTSSSTSGNAANVTGIVAPANGGTGIANN